MSKISGTGIRELMLCDTHAAKAMWLSPSQDKLKALSDMQLKRPNRALVVIGGASLMSPQVQARMQTVFDRVLAPLADELDLTVLDGGTDAGVIHMMGQARHTTQGRFALIGVAPQGKVKLADQEEGDGKRSLHALEPNHTHFFLVPGDSWGAESSWLGEFASLISGDCPSITVLINGGKTSLKDLRTNLEAGRSAIALSGSGRLADKITAAIDGDPIDDEYPEIPDLVQTYQASNKLFSIDVFTPTETLRQYLKQYFT